MKQGRRKFVEQIAAIAGIASLPLPLFSMPPEPDFFENSSGPWLELSKKNYLKNVQVISQMANQKPVLAVLKNNAYGLGDVEVAKILDKSSDVEGFALVKYERALMLKKAGVKKTILLMGDFDEKIGKELAKNGVILSVFSADSLEKIKRISTGLKQKVQVALYIDTGLGRMGIPYKQAFELAKKVAAHPGLEIQYSFSTLTTPKDFAKEQIGLFNTLTQKLSVIGIKVGKTHLAPSFSMIDLQESYQDMVRPGILLHGTYPLADMEASQKWPLIPTFRLKARVIRLEKLSAGDTIGFSRFYKIKQDEWIATLPVGWGDGYDSRAENGAKVLLKGNLYPVVNVNANHVNISLGASTQIQVGDIAILIGPDRPEITPEGFGKLIKGHNYLQIYYKESIPKIVCDDF